MEPMIDEGLEDVGDSVVLTWTSGGDSQEQHLQLFPAQQQQQQFQQLAGSSTETLTFGNGYDNVDAASVTWIDPQPETEMNGHAYEHNQDDVYLSVESFMNTENQQEVFLYDEETGEYQKYVCVVDDYGGHVGEDVQTQAGDQRKDQSNETEKVAQHGVSIEEFFNQTENGTADHSDIFSKASTSAAFSAAAVDDLDGSQDFLAALVRSEGIDTEMQSHSKPEVSTADEPKVSLPLQTFESVGPSASSAAAANASPPLVQCQKCFRKIRSSDFEEHFRDVHSQPDPSDSMNKWKQCLLCGLKYDRKAYLTHFKQHHQNVRLGCPKCPSSYRSPELLNFHYKRFHSTMDVTPASTASSKAAGSVKKFSENSRTSRSSSVFSLHCDICLKTYNSQRDFTNHRRRKDFCKPPVEEEPTSTRRRIGIIRRSL